MSKHLFCMDELMKRYTLNLHKVLTSKDMKYGKSLYGLQKSRKYWYERFTELISKIGFKSSLNHYCLILKEDLYILLYVDDLLIIEKKLKDIEALRTIFCLE